MDGDDRGAEAHGEIKVEDVPKSNGVPVKKEGGRDTSAPRSSLGNSRAPSVSPDAVKQEMESVSTPPKLSRKVSSKPLVVRAAAMLFDHLPDATQEACETYRVINDCLYGSRNMGSSEHDVLDCDCSEEWRGSQNHACGEDSDCINRHTKMECVDGDCNCGVGCQNQRFQRKQYADVSVIKTEKKGFGLRANADLHPNDFIFEYIGEVINEPTFRSRMLRYDKEGIKHFYFMSLTKSEFVDATKKGNLGRFCNHSCNPNCYVDKWVVGQKLRMGIFAGRKIQAGEELVFNYNVDRYGADPQPCYCGERNCTGFIGGKTQTERATKLPAATIEALGIEDGEGWDTAVAKKVRKKKPNEDDQDYVNSFQPRGLEEDDVTKVMAALMQCKEKWIAVKLLARIQQSDSEHVHHRVVRMHGYQILKTAVNTFKDDCNVVLQILDILWKLPRLTKNKIRDSHIEAAIEPLVSSEHEHVAASAKKLLEAWDGLTMAYRIPRQKLDPSAPFPATSVFADERRQLVAEKETKPDVLANVAIPTGPRSSVPQRNVLQQQRNAQFPNGQRPRKLPTNLPAGWSVATDQNGRYYFYDKNHRTTWQRPTQPAAEDNQVSKKVKQEAKSIQDIIDNLTKEPTPRHSSSLTPQRVTTPVPEPKKEKWRSLSREKQMKIWENTLFPHVKHVMDKYRHKLPKEDLKKFAREVNKSLVASDYKHNRVDDPTVISQKHAKKVQAYVRAFFERAVEKFAKHDKKSEPCAESGRPIESLPADGTPTLTPQPVAAKDEDDTAMSDVDVADAASPSSSSDQKRKRDLAEVGGSAESPRETTPLEGPTLKRLKEDDGTSSDVASPTPPPPPPPQSPPPPDGAGGLAILVDDTPTPQTEEERSMREEEEALMRENEEAQRLEEEEEAAAARENTGMTRGRGLEVVEANGEAHRDDAS